MTETSIWRKAKASGDNGGQCVQLADLGSGTVGVRDSKLGDSSPVLTVSRTELADLVAGIKGGEFDDLT